MSKDKNIKLELIEIYKENEEILSNLLSLYLHDLSEFSSEITISQNGLYEFDAIDEYLSKTNLHALLIKVDNNIAGFILLSESPYVKEGCDLCIQEFFILKNYRRNGIGNMALNLLYKKYIGKYCLMIMGKNIIALNFWRNSHKLNNISFEEGILPSDGYYHVFSV